MFCRFFPLLGRARWLLIPAIGLLLVSTCADLLTPTPWLPCPAWFADQIVHIDDSIVRPLREPAASSGQLAG